MVSNGVTGQRCSAGRQDILRASAAGAARQAAGRASIGCSTPESGVLQPMLARLAGCKLPLEAKTTSICRSSCGLSADEMISTYASSAAMLQDSHRCSLATA